MKLADFTFEQRAFIGGLMYEAVLHERDRCADIAKKSGLGDHATNAEMVTWREAQFHADRLCQLIAEAIVTSPADVQKRAAATLSK